jgi:hypothetical protein
LNKKRFITGILILAGCIVVGVWALISAYQDGPSEDPKPDTVINGIFLVLGPFLILGLALSVGEFARSVVKRIKTAREREKVKRDRRRQARQNKPDSASQ